MEPVNEPQTREVQDKSYIKSKKKWKDFKIHENIIDALVEEGKTKPTRVQAETLEITTNPDRKKFNMLIRAFNGAGKTLSFLIPLINSVEPGCEIAQDKMSKGKNQPNQIFKPQGVVIVQTNLLQEQIEKQLGKFIDYGNKNDLQKLKFRIGYLHKDKHEPGDIIVCMAQSFLNRHKRGNMKLDNCKFVAIDEVDDIYEQARDDLKRLLEIVDQAPPNVITCSATMKTEFMKYYEGCCPKFIPVNINQTLEKEAGQKISLEGVANYYKQFGQGKVDIHKYVIKEIFKELYKNTDRKKPQVFIFFNSIDQISQFDKYFQVLAADFSTEQFQYLSNIKRDTIAARVIVNDKKVDLSVEKKREIMTKFRNDETNVLLATNIIARGIDVRNACFVINIGAPRKTEKDQNVDVDLYLHRVGRTGRHNDKGVALTLLTKNETKNLVEGVSRFHKIKISELKSPKQIVEEVFDCIKNNAN